LILEELTQKKTIRENFFLYRILPQADLFRNIGIDERIHKEESLARIQKARFN